MARAGEAVGVPGAAAFMASDEGLAELEQQLRGQKVNGKRVSAAPTFNLRLGGGAGSYDFSGGLPALLARRSSHPTTHRLRAC